MSELPDFILIQEIFEKLYLYKKQRLVAMWEQFSNECRKTNLKVI